MGETLVELVATALCVGLVVGAGFAGHRRWSSGNRSAEDSLLRPVRGVLGGGLLRPASRALAGDLPRGLFAVVWMGAAALALGFVALVYLVVSLLVDF